MADVYKSFAESIDEFGVLVGSKSEPPRPGGLLKDALGNNEVGRYTSLPESIKAYYGFQEYMWLSDAEKEALIHDECTPEYVGEW